jgi:hypothetical protein
LLGTISPSSAQLADGLLHSWTVLQHLFPFKVSDIVVVEINRESLRGPEAKIEHSPAFESKHLPEKRVPRDVSRHLPESDNLLQRGNRVAGLDRAGL